MVKGSARQVILVRPPESDLFEQAIFVLKESKTGEVSDQEILRQANQAAARYLYTRLRGGRAGARRLLWPLICGGLGAGVMGLIWGICAVL